MPSYMPQHVFDALAVFGATATLKGRIDLVLHVGNTYLSHYPDEDAATLFRDVGTSRRMNRAPKMSGMWG